MMYHLPVVDILFCITAQGYSRDLPGTDEVNTRFNVPCHMVVFAAVRRRGGDRGAAGSSGEGLTWMWV
ncbi:hypothetical protein HYALB_00009700 [Hymenoscyphus albidus]|uniref:Uncharacterized protein n=1 Tax=Hymenoscyphus albidus TaxID=595503 RepID=A0A9N9Q294_9HELO|nr:hypothetical protein HYALB_00009700 [Hymenoscyphus albidus]